MDDMEMKMDEIMLSTLSLQDQVNKLISNQIELTNRLKLSKAELKLIFNGKQISMFETKI